MEKKLLSDFYQLHNWREFELIKSGFSKANITFYSNFGCFSDKICHNLGPPKFTILDNHMKIFVFLKIWILGLNLAILWLKIREIRLDFLEKKPNPS